MSRRRCTPVVCGVAGKVRLCLPIVTGTAEGDIWYDKLRELVNVLAQ
jgi:hypothetical protein